MKKYHRLEQRKKLRMALGMRPYKTEFEKAVFERAFRDNASLNLGQYKNIGSFVLNTSGSLVPVGRSHRSRVDGINNVSMSRDTMNKIYLALEKNHEASVKEILELVSAEVERAQFAEETPYPAPPIEAIEAALN